MHRFRTAILIMLLSGIGSSYAFATGREITASGDDLDVRVNWKWAGCINGGYYPIRTEVKNNGATRELTFQFGDADEDDELVPVVRRRVLCESGKTTRLTLLVPVVGKNVDGALYVTDDGVQIAGLKVNVQLPQFEEYNAHGGKTLVGVLAISDVGINTNQLQKTILSVPGLDADIETVSPEMLPVTWLAYTGLDLVLVDLETFQDLPEPVRTAIMRWVTCGGNLMVHRIASNQWNAFDKLLDQEARLADESIQSDEFFKNLFRQEKFKATFIMQGQVIGTSITPWASSATSSARRLFQAIGADRLKWQERNGFIAREGNRHFTEFLIPGVKSVPVYQFLTLITLFTLIIGPVNYLWLWKKRQLNLLLVTIPILAFVTSVALFGYSAVQHGFGVKSRIRSLTILDQGTQESVTHARVAMFAGMSPSIALQFSPQTGVFPIWPSGQTYEQGDVDWTETQSMENGWLRSRTRTQFFLMNHSSQKGRLNVKLADSSGSVSNGLEWPLQMLFVRNENGDLMVANDVPVGGDIQLRIAEAKDVGDFRAIIQTFPVEPPDERKNSLPSAFLEMGRRRNRRNWRQHSVETSPQNFKTSTMERRITALEQTNLSESNTATQSYVAVLKQNPGIDLGIKDTDEQAGLHLLVGYFE